MKVVLIGCDASEIISACYITITSLAKQGHTIYAIIAPAESPELPSSLSERANISELATLGITQTFLIDRFDYSAITQSNADAVNSHIKKLNPSLVMMPSWKSPNHLRKILARSSLIACRGIGTILMYELDVNNTSFNPTVIFRVSVDPSSILHRTKNVTGTTTSGTTDQNEIDNIKTYINNSMLEGRGSKTRDNELLQEKFESHRTLLVEGEGLF